MPYGTARMRVFYGAGDYGRAAALSQMTSGYYQSGGFFSSLKKLAGGIGGAIAKKVLPIATPLLRKLPVVGTAVGLLETAGNIASELGVKKILGRAVQAGPKNIPGARQLLLTGQGGPGAGLPAFGAQVERARRRKRPSRGGGGAPTRRRRRSSRARGDYGDDWSGNKPSRDKRGRYLTRAGGRRHKRRRGRRRGRGGRVSFTTKSGRRVSFTARRGASGSW